VASNQGEYFVGMENDLAVHGEFPVDEEVPLQGLHVVRSLLNPRSGQPTIWLTSET
jgi:hypothetical protein